MNGLWIAALAAQAAQAANAGGAEPPRLDWLAGYWLSCESGREVSETWSDMRGGTMLGMSLTLGASGRISWEQARIGPSSAGAGLSFFAMPSGQAPAEFALVGSGAAEAAFENAAHDFPQRVSYRRDGDRLTARIKGQIGGEIRSMEWRYRSAPLNARCGGGNGERG